MGLVHDLGAAGLLVVAPVAHAAGAETVTLPSGAEVTSAPVIWDEDLSSLRLRFILPALARVDPDDPAGLEPFFADMHWLCDTRLAAFRAAGTDLQGEGWNSVSITLMDRDVAFGTVDPDAVQLIEWFTLDDAGCALELDHHAH
ncbi:MAG: DUF6497 family protein [Roseinatronobacter sp.]